MRILYVVLTGCLYVISIPIQAVIAVVIFCSTGWPVLFAQERIGKNGKRFVMYKFRTMIQGAEPQQAKYLRMNESKGPVFKIHNDPRFTPIGRFLSHTGLDELPQLYNVIRGDMAFIGPRPLPVSEVKALQPWMHARHAILPGIISPAVLTGKYHKNFTWWMKSDVEYARTKSFRKDVTLFLRFVPFVVNMVIREIDAI